jgi:hypothetical protein
MLTYADLQDGEQGDSSYLLLEDAAGSDTAASDDSSASTSSPQRPRQRPDAGGDGAGAVSPQLLTYADVCWRMLAYAGVC